MKSSSLLLFILLFSNCISQKYISNGVDFISEASGVIKLRSTGVGNNVKAAATDAEINAMKQVLFRGIPGATISNPLLSTDEKQYLDNHKEYFNTFFNGKRYSTFIKSEENAVKIKSNTSKGTSKVLLVMEINIPSLKKDLENFGVLRKFGY